MADFEALSLAESGGCGKESSAQQPPDGGQAVLLVGGAGESAETTWNTAENADQVLK